ncbi:MAG TPA: hypothetical protein VFU81_05725, partial [Thermomicrobiales bacterium]|nr:hypothetical protein [Thermomicrobiales bacterium]
SAGSHGSPFAKQLIAAAGVGRASADATPPPSNARPRPRRVRIIRVRPSKPISSIDILHVEGAVHGQPMLWPVDIAHRRAVWIGRQRQRRGAPSRWRRRWRDTRRGQAKLFAKGALLHATAGRAETARDAIGVALADDTIYPVDAQRLLLCDDDANSTKMVRTLQRGAAVAAIIGLGIRRATERFADWGAFVLAFVFFAGTRAAVGAVVRIAFFAGDEARRAGSRLRAAAEPERGAGADERLQGAAPGMQGSGQTIEAGVRHCRDPVRFAAFGGCVRPSRIAQRRQSFCALTR